MQRQKRLCLDCNWAAKGPCPRHPGRSLYMGSKWRPGKKDSKTRLWDNRIHGSVTVSPPANRLDAWPKFHRRSTGPFNAPASPPTGLLTLGAVNFSRGGDDGTGSWDRSGDPARRAIAEKNRKPSRKHELRLPSKYPGWPFPVNLRE